MRVSERERGREKGIVGEAGAKGGGGSAVGKIIGTLSESLGEFPRKQLY